jgi:hypothetical protein
MLRQLFYDGLLQGCIPVIFRVQEQVYNELFGKHLPIGRLAVVINVDPWDPRIAQLMLPGGLATLGEALFIALQSIPPARIAGYRRSLRLLWRFLQYSADDDSEPDALDVGLGLVYKVAREHGLDINRNIEAEKYLFGRGPNGRRVLPPITRAEPTAMPYGTCQRNCSPASLGFVMRYPSLARLLPMSTTGWLAGAYYSLLWGMACYGEGGERWQPWPLPTRLMS